MSSQRKASCGCSAAACWKPGSKSRQVPHQAAHRPITVVISPIPPAARAIVAAAKSLASAGGIVALLVVVLLVGLIAATAASPFGIFFSGEHTPPDAVPVSAAVAEVNGDFNARLEALRRVEPTIT